MRPFSIIVIVAVIGLGMTSNTFAGEPTTADRAEFNKLISQRNMLHKKLDALDSKAAQILKKGGDPVSINAEQTTLQDEMDLLQLKIEMRAARFGLVVPGLPDAKGYGADTDNRPDPTDGAFETGRNRALKVIRAECLQLLKSLDFDGFLGKEG